MTTRWLAAALLLSTVSVLRAEAAGVVEGDRIRVRSFDLGDRRITGRVLEVDEETLLLQTDRSGTAIRIRSSSVQSLERSRGRHGRARIGAAVGGILGGAAGTFMGIVVNALCESECDQRRHEAPLVLGTLGAGAGAGVGAGIGALFRSERWEKPRGPELALRITPERRGAGAHVTLRF